MSEYESDRWRQIAAKVGGGFSAAACKEKALELEDIATGGSASLSSNLNSVSSVIGVGVNGIPTSVGSGGDALPMQISEGHKSPGQQGQQGQQHGGVGGHQDRGDYGHQHGGVKFEVLGTEMGGGQGHQP